VSVKIDQAFIQAFINGGFGLDIAHENLSYTPTAGTEYAQLINLPNDVTPLSLSGSDETDGVFRIILYWPANQGAIQAKLKADEIISAFKIGTQVCYSDQCATVKRTAKVQGVPEDGWYKLVISISYHSILTR